MSVAMPEHSWLWRASAIRVIDGDTIDAVIDAGFHATRTERLRLLGVNAPEMRGELREEGVAARKYVHGWLPVPVADTWPLVIETEKADSFGRYLARVWRVSDGACLNDDLVKSGHAVEMGL